VAVQLYVISSPFFRCFIEAHSVVNRAPDLQKIPAIFVALNHIAHVDKQLINARSFKKSVIVSFL